VRHRVRVGQIEGKAAAGELDRLVEAVVARGQLAGHAIHLAIARRDLERLGRLGLEVLRLVLDVRQRSAQRDRLEARGIHRQRLV
jgi:hypothetical protein